MNEQAPRVGTAGDTGNESEVLREAAATLRAFAARLPAGSPWVEALSAIAADAGAASTAARLRDELAA